VNESTEGALGIAIIGCGLIGHKRAANLPEGVRVVAACDLTVGRAEALVTDFAPEAVPTDDPLSAIAHPEVGLVIVATTHDQLAALGRMAVSEGRHVLLEKPGSHRTEPLLELADLADSLGLQVRVGYNHRFHPGFLKIRELGGEGRYGPLLWIRARYGHGGRIGYDSEWRADPSLSGGGELIDQGSHLIDLTRCLTGEVDLEFSEYATQFWDMPVDDNVYLALRPRTGGFAWLHASWTEWKNLFSFEVSYRTAKFELTGLGGSYGPERLVLHEMRPEMGPPDSTVFEFPEADESWRLETEDVVASIQGRPAMGAAIRDALAVHDIIDEVYNQ
jgi:predicted dehydrogenase|tara:strand:- start:830 stop:1828 length:999 start_codon:yes stop_codon:yes gene_type:complete